MTTHARSERWVAAVLVLAVALVAFWEIMGRYSSRAWKPFEASAERMAGFEPVLPGWRLESIPVGNDPLEPNIVAYRARPQDTRPTPPVLVRVAHGYNMPDCMRIKHYAVDLEADSRGGADAATAAPIVEGMPCQVWRLTSPTDDESIWLTTMLRAYNLSATDRDIRSMAFPKVGTPDDPDWNPQGFTLRSLRRPIYNFKRVLRAKWNASRSDPLTFLGLRQPAYMSNETYTLVTTAVIPPGTDTDAAERRSAARARALQVHTGMLRALNEFSEGQGEGIDEGRPIKGTDEGGNGTYSIGRSVSRILRKMRLIPPRFRRRPPRLPSKSP